MAKEAENLTLEILRGIRGDIQNVRDEIRGDIRGLRQVHDHHTLQLDFVQERVERLRESTMTTLGYAVDATERGKKLEARVDDLALRVEKLEKAK